jgi:uncharacterized membrane protein YeaQ/YmgE (transglycosylase-associated protein family)
MSFKLNKMIAGGNNPSGWVITAVIGIAGAFVGNFLTHMMGWGGAMGQHTIGTIISATIGAVILLFIYQMIQKAQSNS